VEDHFVEVTDMIEIGKGGQQLADHFVEVTDMIEIGKGGQQVALFGVQVPSIPKHLKNIFDAGERVEDSVVSILETTAAAGKNYRTRYYNLDACPASRRRSVCGCWGRSARPRGAQECILTTFVNMDTFCGEASHVQRRHRREPQKDSRKQEILAGGGCQGSKPLAQRLPQHGRRGGPAARPQP
jgi:hypothetical protein